MGGGGWCSPMDFFRNNWGVKLVNATKFFIPCSPYFWCIACASLLLSASTSVHKVNSVHEILAQCTQNITSTDIILMKTAKLCRVDTYNTTYQTYHLQPTTYLVLLSLLHHRRGDPPWGVPPWPKNFIIICIRIMLMSECVIWYHM